MAVFSIGDLSANFSTLKPKKKVSQVQRYAPTLRVLAGLGSLMPGDTGDKINWVVKGSGQVAGNVDTDGGGFLTAAANSQHSAQLDYGTIEAPGKITDSMIDKARMASMASPAYNPFDMVREEAEADAVEEAVKLINQQLYTGTGSSNQPTGFSTAVASSGTYANIAPASLSQWASTVQGNSGVLRSLTIGLMKTFLRTVAVNSRSGRPTLGFAPPPLMDTIEDLFQPYLQIPSPMGAMPAGPSRERFVSNPGSISTVGGSIKMDGYRHFYWASANVYFVEDPDCQNSAESNTTNCILFVNPSELEVLYMPRAGARPNTPTSQLAAVEQDMGPIAGLQFEKTYRARTSHAEEFDINTKLQLKLTSRNAHGWLCDVQ